jgi:hypothetical protein
MDKKYLSSSIDAEWHLGGDYVQSKLGRWSQMLAQVQGQKMAAKYLSSIYDAQ